MQRDAAGISFVVRVRNEEDKLRLSLDSLRELRIPHEKIVVCHLCTDGSADVARAAGCRVETYDFQISRAGYETLATPAKSDHSLPSFYNYCFRKAAYRWCFKWDADHIASSKLIEFLNSRSWNETRPSRIRPTTVFPDSSRANNEPFLFNVAIEYRKYIFWEINGPMFDKAVTEEVVAARLIHNAPLSEIKPYWTAPAWFVLDHSPEAEETRRRYDLIVKLNGPEPVGSARACNRENNEIYWSIRRLEPHLNRLGISLWE